MALNNLTRVTSSGFGTNTNINTAGIITAASFSGDGSGLTGITALGSGVVVQEEGSNVGTAQTINFIGTGVTATFSGGIASVEITTSSGGGGGGLSNVVEDTTPQLGGNLDLNSNNITGTGDINITGDTIVGAGLSVVGVSTFTNNVKFIPTGLAANKTMSWDYTTGELDFADDSKIVLGDELSIYHSSTSNETYFAGFGNRPINIGGSIVNIQDALFAKTSAKFDTDASAELYYNNSKKFETTNTGAVVTGILTATSFSGDGSALTGLTGAAAATYGNGTVVPQITVDANGRITTISNVSISGGGGGGGTTMFIRDSGSLVGAAGTIDFGTNLSVSPVSAGIVTVTGSIAGINTSATSEFTNIDVDGHTDLDNVTIAGVVTATTLVKSGGTSSQFLKADGTVDSSTYLTSYTETDPVVGAINGIVKADGAGNISAASAGTDYLTPSGDGSSLTGIGTAFTNVQATWSLGANGTSAYRFTGPGNDGTEDNPDIYLVRGQKYRFTNNTGGSHPFEIRSSAGGSAYSDGVTNNNAASGNIEINVQHDAPARLFYQCSSHSGMVGNIYVVGGSDWRMTDVNTSTDPEIYTDRYVGIGTDNPLMALHVHGAANSADSRIRLSSAEGSGLTIRAQSATENNINADGGEDITFSRGNVESLRIDSSGNAILKSAGAAFKAENPSSSGDYLRMYANGTAQWDIYTNGELLRIGDNSGNSSARVQFDNPTFHRSTSNTTGVAAVSAKQEVNNGGYLIYEGKNSSDTTVFSVTHNGRINLSENIVFASGQGIDFSATSDAGGMTSELLDDYEEGTWTFTVTPGGGSYQYNYGQTGHYRKIGNLVFINAWIHLTVSSTVSGGITLSGLPYNCHSTSRNWIPVGGYNQASAPASSGLWLILTNGATTGSFLYNDDQFGTPTTLTSGNLLTSAELYINGCYIAA